VLINLVNCIPHGLSAPHNTCCSSLGPTIGFGVNLLRAPTYQNSSDGFSRHVLLLHPDVKRSSFVRVTASLRRRTTSKADNINFALGYTQQELIMSLSPATAKFCPNPCGTGSTEGGCLEYKFHGWERGYQTLPLVPVALPIKASDLLTYSMSMLQASAWRSLPIAQSEARRRGLKRP
jgi:hypothetical protein